MRRPFPAVRLAAVVAASVVVGCSKPALPVLGTIPSFALVDQTGARVDDAALRGHVWIADFVFTRCPDFCPALTARMRTLQERLPTDGDPVRLVSISVDPEHDTPEVLRAYAARAKAGPTWRFLTGSHDAVAALLRDGFKVAWATDGPPASPITHSDRFVLVDRELRIRGYYHGAGGEPLDGLVADARRLQAGG